MRYLILTKNLKRKEITIMVLNTTAFNGTMNSNEFYNSLFNFIRLAQVYSANLSGMDDSLANKYRTDGGMYHDQSIYTDMDVISSRIWDKDDTNVLAPEMVVKPVQEKITVDKFRQIGLYTEEYLSKRAWMSAEKYDEFRAVVQKQVSETKRLYDQRLVDVFVGVVDNGGKQSIAITLPTDADKEKENRLQSMEIARTIADTFVALKDTTPDYNLNGFIKSFDESDFDIVWNATYYNKIRYVDLPTVYHQDGLLKQGRALAERYFGTNTVPASGTVPASNTTVRAADEYFIPVAATGKYAAAGPNVLHVFAGDLLPEGTPVTINESECTYTNITTNINGKNRTVSACTKALAYTQSDKIICKLIHKSAIKYLSSFETGSEFWNAKNLSTNRYLTWAFAKPVALRGYPIITIKSN